MSVLSPATPRPTRAGRAPSPPEAPDAALVPAADPTDAAGIRSTPADGAIPALRLIPGGRREAPVQEELPLEWRLPSGLPAQPEAPAHLRLVGGSPVVPAPDPTPDAAAHAAADPTAERGVDPADGLPPAGPWVARLARAVLEVVSGERPSGQLVRWTSRPVHAELARRAACARRHPVNQGRSPMVRQVRSVRVCPVAPGIVEACAVVSGPQRARAVAIRLEAHRGRWLATAVAVG
ncbi:MAG: Rv3235 family protein [Candidatus Nanopelagicales bacterium]